MKVLLTIGGLLFTLQSAFSQPLDKELSKKYEFFYKKEQKTFAYIKRCNKMLKNNQLTIDEAREVIKYKKRAKKLYYYSSDQRKRIGDKLFILN